MQNRIQSVHQAHFLQECLPLHIFNVIILTLLNSKYTIVELIDFWWRFFIFPVTELRRLLFNTRVSNQL